jgi:hypothetical protein
MVSIAELELNNIADGGGHYIWHKRILRATDDNGNDLVRSNCFPLC